MESTGTVSLQEAAHSDPGHLFLVVATMVAVNLAAFWMLLRGSYHPDSYQAALTGYGGVGLTWGFVSGIAAIGLLIWLRCHPDECQRPARAGRVVTISSIVVLTMRCLGAPVQFLDPILYCTAFGWTTALWLSNGKVLERGPSGLSRGGTLSHHVKPVTWLTLAVLCAAVGLSIYYVAQQIRYFNNLGLGYGDCGESARLMYNTIRNPHELFLRVNPDKPLFYDHVQPGIMPLVPLWILWPDLKLTILLQVISSLGPVLPLYWIGKRLFQDKAAALLLVTAWLVYPSTSQFIYSGSFGFRWGNVCLPLYFLALAFWVHGHHGWALATALWAISIKEEAAILVGMFGVYLALFERRRWLGAVIAVAAFAYFLLITSVVVPALSHQGYLMQRFFSGLGATKWEILLSPWVRPRVFWAQLLSPSTFYFGALLLAPLLFVPLRKASILLVGALVFVFDCLSPNMLHSICYWYQAALLPVVFWALAAALQNDGTMHRRATLSGAIMAGVLLSIFFGNTFWSKMDWSSGMFPGRWQTVERMARQIDPRGSLFATPRVAAHFVTQKYLYTDPALPAQIEYVLLDLHDPLLPPDTARMLQRRVEVRPDLHLVAAEDGLLLYAPHGDPMDRRSVVERDVLPQDVIHQKINLGKGVNILGFSLTSRSSESGKHSDIVHVTTYSTVAALTNTDMAVQCTLEMEGGDAKNGWYTSKVQFLGQSIWPIAWWTTNRVYCDDFPVTVPRGMQTNRFAVRFEVVSLPLIN